MHWSWNGAIEGAAIGLVGGGLSSALCAFLWKKGAWPPFRRSTRLPDHEHDD
jgi:hypothetical protein